MTRRGFMWVAAGVLVLLALGGFWSSYGTLRVTFTQAQMQERIEKELDREFPVKGPAHLLIKSVKVRGATIHIQDNRIVALVDVEGALRTNRNFTLTASAMGMPAYSLGEFFFKPDKVEVQKFAYEGGTPTQFFTGFAKRYVSDDKARQLIEDAAPAIESWMTSVAQNAAVYTLERRPVYRLKDGVKGLLVRASLASVTIDQDRIVVTFSIWHLTASVLLGILCLIAGIVVIWWILIPDSVFALAFAALVVRRQKVSGE